MKNLAALIILVVSSIFFCALSEQLWAENTFHIRIACVIPAIPGVNVPLVKETGSTKSALEEKKALPSRTPLMFQKETREIRISNGKPIVLTVQTVYSR